MSRLTTVILFLGLFLTLVNLFAEIDVLRIIAASLLIFGIILLVVELIKILKDKE